MVNRTCELCREFGVTCIDNSFQDYPSFGTFKFTNRTVLVATGSVSNSVNTSQPIEECPAVTGSAPIESIAQEYIDKANEFQNDVATN